jgi:hypothetical protein
MSKVNSMPYRKKIIWRIRLLRVVIFCMLIYMVAVAELGGGDSRIQTDLAETVSTIIYFGGMIYIISQIKRNKKLLQNEKSLKEQQLIEEDERNQYLHDKSGGIVLDILLVILLFAVLTASFFNMAAFNMSGIILLIAIVLKVGAYIFFSRY